MNFNGIYKEATYTIVYSRGTSRNDEVRYQRKGVKASMLSRELLKFQQRGDGIFEVRLDGGF